MNDKINLIKPQKISLVNNPVLTEKWVQEIIANDPTILGLGDLILKDKERMQPRAGRLDLLLQDVDSERRYEVELQLGKVDESHIIRTIEYYDIEKKRYPQYDHCAVIIAEDITNRFLNVINILNGTVPLIVIKMEAYKNGIDHWLCFTTVLSEVNLGLIEEDEIAEVTDRNYWEERANTKTVELTDELLAIINEFAGGYELKYNKFYIGLAKDGKANNFIVFRPQKINVRAEIRIDQNEELTKEIEDSGLDLMEYSSQWGRYRIRISKQDLTTHRDLIIKIFKMAFEQNNRD
ncbi:MAG: hypothetical protein NT155_00735 [Candidatus Staskawiczbacteria bacterium]|nr:hypothetical protein [Candidatus Staskawiczbacteria bacterium]